MNKLLIANRGEIALRIMRSCQSLDIATVAVYSDADRHALHVGEADEARRIGPAALEHSYLNIDNLLAAARESGADAVHPGYGFLSENAEFAAAVEAAGLIWVGPPPGAMRKMADKISAREIAIAHDVPVIPAVSLAAGAPFDPGEIIAAVSLPLLIKSSAGGGGIGMREVHAPDELAEAINEARDHALRQFGCGDVLIERFISRGRHVEVQIVADKHGQLLHLLERDCSAQRRRQKLLEEAPAADLSEELRYSLHQAALRLAKAVNYQGVGTVEFLVEGSDYYLLEMNTRLQVEHGVTEAICNLDLVELQLEIARGKALKLAQDDINCTGHAIEARIYAEDPTAGFLPATGTLQAFAYRGQPWLRVDSGVTQGSEVSHHYDGLLCKLIVHGENREAASERLQSALAGLRLAGIKSNQRFLRALVNSPQWERGLYTSTVETELPALLVAAEIAPAQLNLALVAATIWQFRRQPPAADQRPWPGAYQLKRHSTWMSGDRPLEVNWRWAAAGEFAFPDLALSATVLEEADDTLVLEIENQRQVFVTQGDSSGLWLWQQALGNLRLDAVHASTAGNAAKQDGRCTSHGPGQVLRVLVAPGQTVEQHQALVVIESMKMESTLHAPRAGQVAEVAVTEGELIASGQLLLRLQEIAENET